MLYRRRFHKSTSEKLFELAWSGVRYVAGDNAAVENPVGDTHSHFIALQR